MTWHLNFCMMPYRTIFAPVASAMTCLVAMLSAFTNLRWLLGCAMAFGFVFGWHWSLMPVRPTLHVSTAQSPQTLCRNLCLVCQGRCMTLQRVIVQLRGASLQDIEPDGI